MPYKISGSTTATVDITVLDIDGNKLARQTVNLRRLRNIKSFRR